MTTYTLTFPESDLEAVRQALRVRAAILIAEADTGFKTEYPVAWRLRSAAMLRKLDDNLGDQLLDNLRRMLKKR